MSVRTCSVSSGCGTLEQISVFPSKQGIKNKTILISPHVKLNLSWTLIG